MQAAEIDVGDGPPKFAVIDATTGDTTIVAAVTGKKIRVLSYVVTAANSSSTARFESGAGGTSLSGVLRLLNVTAFVAPFNPMGYFETLSGEALSLEVTGGDVDGHLTYVEVD